MNTDSIKNTTAQKAPDHVWLFDMFLIVVAVLIDTSLAWGVTFLIWTLTSLFTGFTGLISYVSREISPFKYWFLTATWGVMSLICFVRLLKIY